MSRPCLVQPLSELCFGSFRVCSWSLSNECTINNSSSLHCTIAVSPRHKCEPKRIVVKLESQLNANVCCNWFSTSFIYFDSKSMSAVRCHVIVKRPNS